METMRIGSGDTTALLSGAHTETHYNLLRRFVSGVRPYRNAKRSPIDALRTGAILEDRYLQILPDGYYSQVREICKCMDVLECTLDFAKIEAGQIMDFDELKTCNFDDFLKFEQIRENENLLLDHVKRHYRNNYNQVQQQLLCTGLQSANLVFLAVYTYDDEVNTVREIKENEYIKIRIKRDKPVIDLIKERVKPFQYLKDYYLKSNNN